MATSYKALLALGESHTKTVESSVQAALAQKKLKEQQRRKQQEEQERKERELEKQLRLKYFEEQRKKAEAEAKAEEDRKAKEADFLRREAAQRDALRYGPKKAKTVAASSKWPTSNSGVRDEVRKKRLPDDDDDAEVDPGSVLTREEKRERKLQAELKRAFHAPRKSGASSTGTRKTGRRLPGGAYDLPTNPADAVNAASSSGNVKDRLTSMPNTLTRLNVNKRDTRTIDEIVRDRRREQKEVLDGDRARTFDDWFTSTSRTKKEQEKTLPASSSASPASSQPPSRFGSQPVSRPPPVPAPSTAATKRAPAPPSAAATTVPTSKPKPKTSAPPPQPSSSSSKKRPRSLSASRSLSPPPPKRSHAATVSPLRSGAQSSLLKAKSRARSPPPSRGGMSSLSDEIWGIFGKNKAAYTARDVFSDSEDDGDMEADADAVEYEERISERHARKEEREAEMEERRHEEEKRRRKAAAAAVHR